MKEFPYSPEEITKINSYSRMASRNVHCVDFSSLNFLNRFTYKSATTVEIPTGTILLNPPKKDEIRRLNMFGEEIIRHYIEETKIVPVSARISCKHLLYFLKLVNPEFETNNEFLNRILTGFDSMRIESAQDYLHGVIFIGNKDTIQNLVERFGGHIVEFGIPDSHDNVEASCREV